MFTRALYRETEHCRGDNMFIEEGSNGTYHGSVTELNYPSGIYLSITNMLPFWDTCAPIIVVKITDVLSKYHNSHISNKAETRTIQNHVKKNFKS